MSSDPRAMYATEAGRACDCGRHSYNYVRRARLGAVRQGRRFRLTSNTTRSSLRRLSRPHPRGRKTMIQYSKQLISSDIPAPQASRICVTSMSRRTHVCDDDRTRSSIFIEGSGRAGWKSPRWRRWSMSMGGHHDLSQSREEMITLSVPYDYGGKLGVSVRYKAQRTRRARSQMKR